MPLSTRLASGLAEGFQKKAGGAPEGLTHAGRRVSFPFSIYDTGFDRLIRVNDEDPNTQIGTGRAHR